MEKRRKSSIIFNLVMLIVTIAFGIAPLIQNYYYNNRILTFDIVDAKFLAKNMSDKPGKIDIYYDGKPVTDDILITTISFKNEGKIPITPEDFIEPISFKFNNDSRVLDIANLVRDNKSNNLVVKYRYQDNIFTILPTLINPGDTITFNIITDGFTFKLEKMSYRIKGIQKIESKASIVDKPKHDNAYRLLVWFVSIVGASFAMSMMWFCVEYKVKLSYLFEKIIITYACVIPTTYMFNNLMFRMGYKLDSLVNLCILLLFSLAIYIVRRTHFVVGPDCY